MQNRNAHDHFTLLLIARQLLCHLLTILISTAALGLRTNLVIEDGLPQIFKESRNLPMGPIGAGKFRRFRPRPQFALDFLEFPGGNSTPSTTGGEITYRITSPRRICSVTSRGSESKRSSNAMMREMSPSTLFLVATTSCRQKGVSTKNLSNGMPANLVICRKGK